MRRIKITKVEEENSKNLQGISLPIGAIRFGVEYTHPTLGCKYTLYPLDIEPGLRKEDEKGIETTPIKEIITENSFKTDNSIYVIEELI